MFFGIWFLGWWRGCWRGEEGKVDSGGDDFDFICDEGIMFQINRFGCIVCCHDQVGVMHGEAFKKEVGEFCEEVPAADDVGALLAVQVKDADLF